MSTSIDAGPTVPNGMSPYILRRTTVIEAGIIVTGLMSGDIVSITTDISLLSVGIDSRTVVLKEMSVIMAAIMMVARSFAGRVPTGTHG